MTVTTLRHDLTTAPGAIGLLAGVGSAAALLATYWDDSWHTDRGRDEFAIPPHLVLYGGVLVASLAVAAWGVLSLRRAGWGLAGLRTVLAEPALLLAGLGGTTTLASAPLDAAWHARYGRDAVLWSPPHLAAIVGTLGLAVGLLAGLRGVPGRAAAVGRLLAAAGTIGALQVPVLEYDSDVPQFPVLWFLPVAALGACAALALLDDLLPGRWAAARAAVAYTALRAATVAFLSLTGFSLTAVPPIALLFAGDALLGRSRPLALRLPALGAAAPLVWWPFLVAQAGATTVVPARLLPGAVALGAVAGAAVALAHGDLRPRRLGAPGAAALVVVLALLVLAAPAGQPTAWAHDPGQGEQVRAGTLTVSRTADRAVVVFTLPGSCDGLTTVGTSARRAGVVRRGPLVPAEAGKDCRVEGEVSGLDDGRWFVYAEMRDQRERPLEAWIPVRSGDAATALRPLYAPPAGRGTGGRDAVGAALLLVVAGLLVACLRLARRSAARASDSAVVGQEPVAAGH